MYGSIVQGFYSVYHRQYCLFFKIKYTRLCNRQGRPNSRIRLLLIFWLLSFSKIITIINLSF